MSIESHRYPSGLTVHVDTVPGRSITAMNVHLPYGSVHEAPGQEGIAHALEHAVFIQTPAFKSLSAVDLHSQLSGMYHNAATNYTNTTHETRGLTIGPALHHLSQILQHSQLPAKGIAGEMKSIRREARTMLDDLDNMHDVAGDLALFGQPYGRSIIGFHDKLQFTPEQLREAYHTNYTLGSMTLVVVGAATMEEVAAALPSYFDLDTPQPANVQPLLPIPAYREGTTTGLVQADSGSLRLSVSHPLSPDMAARIKANEELYYIAITVVRDKCFEVMRYDRGLSYESDIQIADYNHMNAWALRGSVVTDGEQRARAIQTLDEALRKPGSSYGSRRIKGALAMGAFGVVGSLESTNSRIDAYTDLVDRNVPVIGLDATEELVRSFTVADVRGAIDDLVEIAATVPRFEHRSGTRKSVGQVDSVIKRSEFI